MLINKKYLMLFSIPLITLPVISLASCASVSQYGTNVAINFGTNNPFAGPDAAKPFTYSYNPMSGTYYKDGKNYNIAENVELLRFCAYLESVRLFVDKLVTASHYDKVLSHLVDPMSIYDNTFSSSTTPPIATQNQLNEFMLASANILNQGDDGDLKFGVTEINIESMPTTTGIFNLVSVDPEANPAPTASDLTIVDKEKKTLETPTTTSGFNLSFNYTYYDAGNSDVFNNKFKDLTQVINYLKTDKAWGDIVPTTLNWKVSLPLITQFKSTYTTTRDLASNNNAEKISYDKKTDKFSGIEYYIEVPTLPTDGGAFLSAFLPFTPTAPNTVKFENRTKLLEEWFNKLNTYTTKEQLKEFSKSLTLVPVDTLKP
ncbi:MAG: hypothetical protein RSA87_01155 [Malacoplasma sp.]